MYKISNISYTNELSKILKKVIINFFNCMNFEFIIRRELCNALLKIKQCYEHYDFWVVYPKLMQQQHKLSVL